MDAVPSKRVPLWRSLRAKYVLTYLVLIAAVLVLLNSYPVLVSETMVFQSKQTSLQSQANVMAAALAGPDGLSRDSVERVMEVLGSAGLSRVVVTDADGEVLYDDDPSGDGSLSAEVASALAGNDEFRSEYIAGAFHSRAAVPITYRSMIQGAVYIHETDAGQGRLLQNVQQTLRTISIITVALSLGLSLLFSQALTGRMARLLSAIRTVREGEYSHRVTTTGSDELAVLTDEFNALTHRLQTTEEARRRFVSDASHELKTPLASIRLLTDSILQSDSIDPDTVREFVGDIGDEAERLQRITEHLLTLTRLDAQPTVETHSVDVSETVRRAAHLLAPLAGAAGVTLHLELDDGARVEATEDDLYQILFNLMENAVKYNLPGGSVTVETARDGGSVVITVTDTGVGIPAEEMDKIFDRFYRVDKARSRAAGGTGLGLSIVQDAARRCGGIVVVQRRTEGEGTRFTVTFPEGAEGQ